MLLLLALAACDRQVELSIAVKDPCNKRVIENAEFIELSVSGETLQTPVVRRWQKREGTGVGIDLPTIEDALVTVVGRAADANGTASTAVSAATLGPLDLSGDTEDQLSLTFVMGSVGGFHSETDFSDNTRCLGLGLARTAHTASLFGLGTVLLVGGGVFDPRGLIPYRPAEIYDLFTGTLKEAGNLNFPRYGHTATVLPDGRVLVAGGVGALAAGTPTALSTGEIYDPASPTTGPRPVILQGQRAFHTATLLDDGSVLLAGGQDDTHALDSTEIFSDSTETTPGPALLRPRAYHTAVFLGASGALLVGGSAAGQRILDTEFVSGRQASLVGPKLSVGRTYPAAGKFPSSDHVLVAGGFAEITTDPWAGAGTDTVDLLAIDAQRPAEGSSAVACPDLRLPGGIGAAQMLTLPDGLLLVGGVISAAAVSQNAYRLSFAATPCEVTIVTVPMADARALSAAVVLPGGDVLVTGGYQVSETQTKTTLKSMERFTASRR